MGKVKIVFVVKISTKIFKTKKSNRNGKRFFFVSFLAHRKRYLICHWRIHFVYLSFYWRQAAKKKFSVPTHDEEIVEIKMPKSKMYIWFSSNFKQFSVYFEFSKFFFSSLARNRIAFWIYIKNYFTSKFIIHRFDEDKFRSSLFSLLPHRCQTVLCLSCAKRYFVI